MRICDETIRPSSLPDLTQCLAPPADARPFLERDVQVDVSAGIDMALSGLLPLRPAAFPSQQKISKMTNNEEQ